jgi:hypothetical protein
MSYGHSGAAGHSERASSRASEDGEQKTAPRRGAAFVLPDQPYFFFEDFLDDFFGAAFFASPLM